jgi:hypothetical protein
MGWMPEFRRTIMLALNQPNFSQARFKEDVNHILGPQLQHLKASECTSHRLFEDGGSRCVQAALKNLNGHVLPRRVYSMVQTLQGALPLVGRSDPTFSFAEVSKNGDVANKDATEAADHAAVLVKEDPDPVAQQAQADKTSELLGELDDEAPVQLSRESDNTKEFQVYHTNPMSFSHFILDKPKIFDDQDGIARDWPSTLGGEPMEFTNLKNAVSDGDGWKIAATTFMLIMYICMAALVIITGIWIACLLSGPGAAFCIPITLPVFVKALAAFLVALGIYLMVYYLGAAPFWQDALYEKAFLKDVKKGWFVPELGDNDPDPNWQFGKVGNTISDYYTDWKADFDTEKQRIKSTLWEPINENFGDSISPTWQYLDWIDLQLGNAQESQDASRTVETEVQELNGDVQTEIEDLSTTMGEEISAATETMYDDLMASDQYLETLQTTSYDKVALMEGRMSGAIGGFASAGRTGVEAIDDVIQPYMKDATKQWSTAHYLNKNVVDATAAMSLYGTALSSKLTLQQQDVAGKLQRFRLGTARDANAMVSRVEQGARDISRILTKGRLESVKTLGAYETNVATRSAARMGRAEGLTKDMAERLADSAGPIASSADTFKAGVVATVKDVKTLYRELQKFQREAQSSVTKTVKSANKYGNTAKKTAKDTIKRSVTDLKGGIQRVLHGSKSTTEGMIKGLEAGAKAEFEKNKGMAGKFDQYYLNDKQTIGFEQKRQKYVTKDLVRGVKAANRAMGKSRGAHQASGDGVQRVAGQDDHSPRDRDRAAEFAYEAAD